jgi:hypothetical protein
MIAIYLAVLAATILVAQKEGRDGSQCHTLSLTRLALVLEKAVRHFGTPRLWLCSVGK